MLPVNRIQNKTMEKEHLPLHTTSWTLVESRALQFRQLVLIVSLHPFFQIF